MLWFRSRSRRGHGFAPMAAALALMACSGEVPAGDTEAATADATTAEAPGEASTAEAVLLSGYLTVDQGPVLALCGTGEERTVDGPAYAELLDLHAVLAPGMQPLEGVFIEVLGAYVEGDRGPAVEALEVRRAAWEGGGCTDPQPDLAFRASGTEPFWSLSVMGESMTWRTPEGQEALEHRGPYRSDRGDWLVDGTFDAGAPVGATTALSARFYAEPCRDAMSGAWFHLSAEVAFEGREFQGCAYMGGESLP